MAKQLTSWRKQGRTTAITDYDGSTIDYDGAVTRYAGNGETHQSVIKQLTPWDKAVKAVTRFIINPASDTNQVVYNTASAYNVATTYDSIVTGEPRSTAKKPIIWTKS